MVLMPTCISIGIRTLLNLWRSLLVRHFHVPGTLFVFWFLMITWQNNYSSLPIVSCAARSWSEFSLAFTQYLWSGVLGIVPFSMFACHFRHALRCSSLALLLQLSKTPVPGIPWFPSTQMVSLSLLITQPRASSVTSGLSSPTFGLNPFGLRWFLPVLLNVIMLRLFVLSL